MDEPRVLLRFPCEKCDGTGRVPGMGVTGGTPLGSADRPCPACEERGYVNKAVPLSEFKTLLDAA